MKTRRIAAMAALAAAVLLAGCVEGGYYSEVGWGGPVYGPRYVDPYIGGYYPRYGGPRYGGFQPRYDRYHRRYDRRYERARRHVVRPDRLTRPGYSRPLRPAPILARPQTQPPRTMTNLSRGRIDCSGPGCSGLRGRGKGWAR